MMNDTRTKQAVVTSQTSIDSSQVVEPIALFNADGTPVALDAMQLQTGADVVLTGYVAGIEDPVSPTDTVNEAIAKVEAVAVAAAETQTGDDILLTGYVPVTGDILATDTLNEAIAKFEARIEALETP
jgi:hypothetical protein